MNDTANGVNTESDSARQGGDAPHDIAAPDVYTLEIPPDQFEDFTHWTASGKLSIQHTPEQREEFLDWMENYLEEHR